MQAMLKKPSLTIVDELQCEKWRILRQEAQKDAVALPKFQTLYALLLHPGELPLVARDRLSREAIRREEMHVLRHPVARNERDERTELPAKEPISRLLLHLAQQAFLGRLVRLEVTADADPLAVIDVVLLDCAVQHQVLTLALDIAKPAHPFHEAFPPP